MLYGSDEYPTIKHNLYDEKIVLVNNIKVNIPDYDKSLVEWGMIGMVIREIEFMICPVAKCNAITGVVDEEYSNTVVTKECSGGKRVLYCSNGLKPMWQELSSSCTDKPLISYQEIEYTFVTGDTVKDLVLFTILGTITEYTINPSINGITIDSNGKLQGRPLEVTAKQEYTITAKGPNGNVDIKIQIEVQASTKPYLLFNNETLNMYVGEEFKDVVFAKIAGDGVTYKEIGTLPDGIHIDSETGYLFGQYLREETVEISVNASNANGYVQYSVSIKFAISDYPIVGEYSPNVELYYYESYSFKQIIKCYGKSVKYELTGKLPEGISFDSGMLNGKTTVGEMTETSYTIKCSTDDSEKVEEREIKISVTIADYPIIISYPESLTIKAGDMMDNKEILNVTGKNLTYIITPSI